MTGGGPVRVPLTSRERTRWWAEVAIAAILGFAAVVVPVLADPGRRRHDAAFLPFVRDAVEGMQLVSLPLLAGAGLLLGLLGRAPVWLVGPATMLAFPLWSTIDLIWDTAFGAGDNHNLLPFEWCVYAGLSLLGLAGAYVGRLLQRPTSRISHAS